MATDATFGKQAGTRLAQEIALHQKGKHDSLHAIAALGDHASEVLEQATAAIAKMRPVLQAWVDAGLPEDKQKAELAKAYLKALTVADDARKAVAYAEQILGSEGIERGEKQEPLRKSLVLTLRKSWWGESERHRQAAFKHGFRIEDRGHLLSEAGAANIECVLSSLPASAVVGGMWNANLAKSIRAIIGRAISGMPRVPGQSAEVASRRPGGHGASSPGSEDVYRVRGTVGAGGKDDIRRTVLILRKSQLSLFGGTPTTVTVKQHTAKTKGGKVVTVKQHTATVRKVAEEAPKGKRQTEAPSTPAVGMTKWTDEQFAAAVRDAAAIGWLALKASEGLEGKAAMEHSDATTKHRRDEWLMERFGIDRADAHDLSNLAESRGYIHGGMWDKKVGGKEPTWDEYPDLAEKYGQSKPSPAPDPAAEGNGTPGHGEPSGKIRERIEPGADEPKGALADLRRDFGSSAKKWGMDYVSERILNEPNWRSSVDQAAYGIRWSWKSSRLNGEAEAAIDRMRGDDVVKLISDIASKIEGGMVVDEVPRYLNAKYSKPLAKSLGKRPVLVLRKGGG